MNDSAQGSILGEKYRLGPVLGRGGMGVVREASHVRLGTKFAVKLLNATSDQIERTRFEREALAASALNNRHVVRVFDIGETPAGSPYMVMELLRGKDIAALAREEPSFDTARVVDWMIQVCSAMYEAHGAGIVHRDLKPSNMFLVEGSQPELIKVVDFGISKVLSAQELTLQASFLGTPQYMAPEQLRGQPVDHRADLWAMGVILYRLLSRQFPFASDENQSPILAALSNLTTEPIPLERVRADLPADLVRIVMRALQRNPDDRFADARAMAAELAPFGSGRVSFEEPSESSAQELLERLHENITNTRAPLELGNEETVAAEVTGSPVSVPERTPRRSLRVPVLLAGLLVLGIGAWLLIGRATLTPPRPEVGTTLAPASVAPVLSLPALEQPAPSAPSAVESAPAPTPARPSGAGASKGAAKTKPTAKTPEHPALPTHL